ncbi:acetyl-CoA synthetase, partial [Rhizoclosmatium sp. JEL0117]
IVGDEGDAILSPAPVYGSFGRDVEASSGLRFVTVNPLDNLSNSEVTSPSKRVKRDIEEYPSINQLNNALDKDPRIKALLLTNPGNPSGRIIPRDTLLAYLKWANSKNLHVIVDEVYAFSVWNLDAQNKFLSALEVGEDVIRKDLVHVIWSFSKDFCMNGQRAAVIMYV